MRHIVLVMLGIGILSGMADGQSGSQPEFDVASIKAGGDLLSTKPDLSAGRIRWTTQLAYLTGYAYRLDFSRVSCKVCGSTYSLEATFDPKTTDDRLRLMLQALLAERFKMRVHRVSTEVDGYALVVGKSGLKIKEADLSHAAQDVKPESFVAATMPKAGIYAVTGRNASMAQLVENLQRSTKVAVWDRTGLTGNYDFVFRFTRDSGIDNQAEAPDLATALAENLGLKLEKQKGTVETLVVDSVQEPSAN